MLTQYSKRVALKFKGIINHKSANNGLHDRAHRKMLRNISLRNGPARARTTTVPSHDSKELDRFYKVTSYH